MELKRITNSSEHVDSLEWIDAQLDLGVQKGTQEGNQLEVALILIKDYEDRFYPIPTPDPIKAIKLKMEEKGIKNKDLVGKIGSKSYVSSILSKRKPLTLDMARIFHKELGILQKYC